MVSIKDQWALEQQTALTLILQWAGDIPTLAKLAGVDGATVHGWVKRGRISATAAIEIEKQSRGQFTRQMIRPDVREWWS